MKTFATFALAAAGAFVLAAPGVAKELKAAAVCGASGCAAITDRPAFTRLIEGGSEESANPGKTGPYYRVKATVEGDGEEFSWSMYYVPGAHAMRSTDERGEGAWYPVVGLSRAQVERLFAGVEPYPTPRITAATVNGRRVTGDVRGYIELFNVPAGDHAMPKMADWVPIDLRASRPSPWTDGLQDLMFSPSTGLLERGIQFAKVDAATADDVAAAKPIDLGGGGSGFPWTSVVLAIAGAIGALALLAFLLRRRPLGLPERRPTAAPAS